MLPDVGVWLQLGLTCYLAPLQFLGRPGQAWRQGLPTDWAGHPPNESQDHRHRRSPLLLQEPQFQVRTFFFTLGPFPGLTGSVSIFPRKRPKRFRFGTFFSIRLGRYFPAHYSKPVGHSSSEQAIGSTRLTAAFFFLLKKQNNVFLGDKKRFCLFSFQIFRMNLNLEQQQQQPSQFFSFWVRAAHSWQPVLQLLQHE